MRICLGYTNALSNAPRKHRIPCPYLRLVCTSCIVLYSPSVGSHGKREATKDFISVTAKRLCSCIAHVSYITPGRSLRSIHRSIIAPPKPCASHITRNFLAVPPQTTNSQHSVLEKYPVIHMNPQCLITDFQPRHKLEACLGVTVVVAVAEVVFLR